MLIYCMHSHSTFGGPMMILAKDPDMLFEDVIENLCLKVAAVTRGDAATIALGLIGVTTTMPGGAILKERLIESQNKRKHMCVCVRVDSVMALSITWIDTYAALLEWRPKLPY